MPLPGKLAFEAETALDTKSLEPALIKSPPPTCDENDSAVDDELAF